MSVKKIHLFPSEKSYVANSGSVEADDLALVPLVLAPVAKSGSFDDLNNLPQAYITETWHVGTSWYRMWSDGWIEQGGRISTNTTTVSFHTAFRDTNYMITVSQNGSASANVCRVAISARATSNFTIEKLENAMLPFSWFACGY